MRILGLDNVNSPVRRSQADYLFLAAQQSYRVSALRARIRYAGVRIGAAYMVLEQIFGYMPDTAKRFKHACDVRDQAQRRASRVVVEDPE